MLDNLRNPLPGLEKTGDLAMDRIKKAANGAAQVAKDATCQMEDWAKAGYGSARDAATTKPVMWGAVSLGFGAVMGGLYALWQRGAPKTRPARKTLPARARAKQSLRGMTQANGSVSGTKRKAKRTVRAPRLMDS
jgi:hypothetical protein